MTDVLNIRFGGLSGSVALELPEGATVADAREAAGIDDDLSIRVPGEGAVSREDEASVELSDDTVLTTAPPQAKQGR